MRRRTWIIVLIIAVLSAALAEGAYWYWVNSPRYALQRMALALKTKNMPEFFKYVDLKAILNNIIVDSSQDLEEAPSGQEDDWHRLSRKMGGKFARLFLPKLFDTFEKEIKGLLEKYLTNLDNSQILGIVAAATTAKIEVQGGEARVTLVEPKTQKPLRFEMRRAPQTKTWQIVAINYQDFKNFAKEAF